MNHRSIFLAAVTLATTGLAAGASQSEGPDLNGFWTHGFSLGFDPPPEGGPGPVHDLKTKAQMRAMGQFLVHEADASNPILQPWAAAEVKKACGRAKPLSVADVKRLKGEHVVAVVPLQTLAGEAVDLERRVSDLVNAAYGLTPEEVAPMWRTAPPRIPGEPPVA